MYVHGVADYDDVRIWHRASHLSSTLAIAKAYPTSGTGPQRLKRSVSGDNDAARKAQKVALTVAQAFGDVASKLQKVARELQEA